jgi:hypothetical protein
LPESRIRSAINKVFKEAGENVVEERVAEYIIRELHSGRTLSNILEDHYVKNRLDEGHIQHVLQNEKLLKEFEESIKEHFPHIG